jgi:uncharacterized membrane protein (Fun14 family)
MIIMVSVGVGGIVGFAMGAFLKHAIEWIAIFGGFVITLLAHLQYENLVSVDRQSLGNRSYEATVGKSQDTGNSLYHIGSGRYTGNSLYHIGSGRINTATKYGDRLL